MTTKKTVTFGAAVLLAVAIQMTASASSTIPGTNIQYDHYLTKSDSGIYSLTTGRTSQNWSDGYTIQAEDEHVALYIPSGLTAYATKETQTIVPKIYCAGRVSNSGTASLIFEFNNLFLLEGGEIHQSNIGRKAGKITILSEDAEHPALLNFSRSGAEDYPWRYPFYLRARFIGSKDSQLLYQLGGLYPGMLTLETGSDWSGFEGTLRVADGLGIANVANVPVSMPGAVRFGRDGILKLTADSAPYSFGELSFAEGGSITNTGSGATLTVAGTFDTGTNCYWLSGNPGTFGTLILGDGLTLRNEQSTPTTVLTVTNRLEVGKKITIEYAGVSVQTTYSKAQPKLLLMKLTPEAVAAGVPDLSGVAVSLKQAWSWRMGYLTTEADPEVSGGLLVYATVGSFFRYRSGPDEWNETTNRGKWLDPVDSLQYWDDGSYPAGDSNIYYVAQTVFITASSVSTFPAKTLIIKDDLCVTAPSAYVTNLYIYGGLLYIREANIHFGGNITPVDGLRKIRCLKYGDFYLDAALHGPNGLVFESYSVSASGGAAFHLTADNSDWTGNLLPWWTVREAAAVSVNETYHTRIVVGDAKALGGNPKTFTFGSMMLTDYAEIRFTNTTVQTASNRGLCVTNGILRVDQGATADLTAPVTLNGTLRKVGAGTLGLGGGIRWAANNDLTDTTAPAAGENVLLVQEGAVKASSLALANVTFSDGAGIAADAASGAMDLSGATVAAAGTINLTADANTLSEPTTTVVYPVVKVSAEQNATLGPAFKATKVWQGWTASLVSETDGDGNVTYSVKYRRKGTIVAIQ